MKPREGRAAGAERVVPRAFLRGQARATARADGANCVLKAVVVLEARILGSGSGYGNPTGIDLDAMARVVHVENVRGRLDRRLGGHVDEDVIYFAQ